MNPSGQQWGYGLPDQAHPQPAPSPASGTRPRWAANLRGDLTGGFTAAVLTIPVSMGYGLLAFAALGEAFVPQAILAGLYAPVCGCIVALLLGANTTMIYSPRSIVTFLIGAIVLQSLVRSDLPFIQHASPTTLLVLSLLLVFVAGAFQVLFGCLRLGTWVKYIPAPVIAGFQNAAAILIFSSQLNSMLGFHQPLEVLSIPLHLNEMLWPTLMTGIVTCLLIIKGARLTKRIPPTILGLLGGVLVYYLFSLIGLGNRLGPVVGDIPYAWPDPHYFLEFAGLVAEPQFWQVVPVLLSGAFSLAVVASLDGVLCARLVESDSGNRIQSNRELTRLGLGNMVAAGFGAIANGINLGSSFANHRSGARTSWSILIHAMVILLVILALSPLLSHIPRVVIAAMLVVVAVQLFDRWTLQIFRKLIRREFSSAQPMLLDLLVIVVVTTVAVAVNIVFAVVIGIAVTVLFFLFRMSKSVIRRAYRCDTVHSRKTRAPEQMEYLSDRGSRILVLELDGPVFFGTAENLAAHVESSLRQETSCVIFDLKRVSDIDSTGAKVLLKAHDDLTRDGRIMLISSLARHSRLFNFLQDMGVIAALTHRRLFDDSDRAIEWAEDYLLMSEREDFGASGEFPFHRIEVFAHMNEQEHAILKSILKSLEYRQGETVIREGDPGTELYIIARGSASVRLTLPGSERTTRLITFSPGTVFGELALLDQEARSATVTADNDLTCYVLALHDFHTLTLQHPAIAIKLLSNLARELSGRLRRANRTIYQLTI
jgi:sulfate permease, SulP family